MSLVQVQVTTLVAWIHKHSGRKEENIIETYNTTVALQQGGGQVTEEDSEEQILIRTDTLKTW